MPATKQANPLQVRLAKLAKVNAEAGAEAQAKVEAAQAEADAAIAKMVEDAETEANRTDSDRLADANAKIAELDATIGTMLDNLTEADATIAKLRTAKNAKGGIEAVFNLPDLKASTSTYGNEMRRGEIVANGLTYRLTVSRYDASKPKPQRR